jgi:hypothetical protein
LIICVLKYWHRTVDTERKKFIDVISLSERSDSGGLFIDSCPVELHGTKV